MARQSEPGPLTSFLGYMAYEFTLIQPLLPVYLHLLVSALFPIYTGAHASLSCPSSAAKPSRPRTRRGSETAHEEDVSESEEEEEYQRMEGLSPSDAIVFPLLAGTTLAGLYFLIKWLGDAEILNKVLNWYFGVFGLVSITKMLTDALNVAHQFVFPRRYVDAGRLWHVHGRERKTTLVKSVSDAPIAMDHAFRPSPLPGLLGRIPLPSRLLKAVWSIRQLFGAKFALRLYAHRVGKFKANIGIHGVFSAIAAVTAVAYFNFVDKPWYLTNLLGFSFSYNALQIMSPTTFNTGSLILGALFFYDIYFVFFTPMMVTVAKSLDIPIKLVFPQPALPEAEKLAKPRHAMLGLGDVVLPGIMIGLALRFDQHLHYFRKQTIASISSPELVLSESSTPPTGSSSEPSVEKASSSTTVAKAKYTPISPHHGEIFWTHHIFSGRPCFPPQRDPSHSHHSSFPKVYFNASLAGYIVGMVTTVVVMQIYGHAQPALLYLVPGVLGAIWGTALIRGELKDVWNFSEAVENDENERKTPKMAAVDSDNPAPGLQSLDTTAKADGVSRDESEKTPPTPIEQNDSAGKMSKEGRGQSRADSRNELLSISILAPFPLRPFPSSKKAKPSKEDGTPAKWNYTAGGKRVRLA